MQQLLVLFVGSFTHKKCLLLVDCVNCIYASAWVKCNKFEVILGRFFFCYELLVSVFLCSRIQRLDTSNTKNHHKISLNVYFYFTIPIHFFHFHIMPSSLSLKSCQLVRWCSGKSLNLYSRSYWLRSRLPFVADLTLYGFTQSLRASGVFPSWTQQSLKYLWLK
jgi:hypothetical protein